MKITRFEDLECWKEARKLVNIVYAAIRSSKPFQSDYRLKDQSTGAAVSVMGNIPEGFVRRRIAICLLKFERGMGETTVAGGALVG